MSSQSFLSRSALMVRSLFLSRQHRFRPLGRRALQASAPDRHRQPLLWHAPDRASARRTTRSLQIIRWSARAWSPYSAQLVKHSRWLPQLQRINSVHSGYRPELWAKRNHYVFWFHDTTFEGIAEGLAAAQPRREACAPKKKLAKFRESTQSPRPSREVSRRSRGEDTTHVLIGVEHPTCGGASSAAKLVNTRPAIGLCLT